LGVAGLFAVSPTCGRKDAASIPSTGVYVKRAYELKRRKRESFGNKLAGKRIDRPKMQYAVSKNESPHKG
jgi:hypothetical protein